MNCSRLARIGIAIGVMIISLVAVHPEPAVAAPNCPAKSAAMPVVSWLLGQVDSVTVHHFNLVNNQLVEASGYPITTADPDFLQRLLNLTGSYVKWNGYDAPSPFGYFYYPNWGSWYAQYELHVGGAVYSIWMWRSRRYYTGSLLVFTFSDMAQAADGSGQYAGQHDFCMTAVPVWSLNRLESSLNVGK
jgi:hypothetical protein